MTPNRLKLVTTNMRGRCFLQPKELHFEQSIQELTTWNLWKAAFNISEISLQIFRGYLPQILLGLFMDTLPYLSEIFRPFKLCRLENFYFREVSQCNKQKITRDTWKKNF